MINDKVDNILRAVNVVDLEGIKEVKIDVKDLITLRNYIWNLGERLANAERSLGLEQARNLSNNIRGFNTYKKGLT